MKRFLSTFLIFVILVTTVPLLPIFSLKANAGSPALATQSEAMSWLYYQADHRTPFDVDGIYGIQCSDFGTAYINWLISGNTALYHPYTTHNAKEYFFDISYPDGWIKINYYVGFVPEPGDILVWGDLPSNPNGHIAVAIDGCTASSIKCIDQDGETGRATGYNATSYNYLAGVIRPLFNVPATPNYAKLSIDKTEVRIGETFTFTCDSDVNYASYWFSIYNVDTGALVMSGSRPRIHPESFLAAGHYAAYMAAGTLDSNWVEFYVYGSPPTIATLTVDKNMISINDSIEFNIKHDAYYAKIYMSIYSQITGEVIEGGWISSRYFFTPHMAGAFSAHISAYTIDGTVDSNRVDFIVYDSNEKYMINYNANGGTGEPETQTKEEGKCILLSDTIPVKTGYKFCGWSVSDKATTVDYGAGEIYTANESVTLYAVWEKDDLNLTMKLATPYVVKNGERINAVTNPQGCLPKPLLVNYSAVLPMRFVCETLGFEVGYDAATNNSSVINKETGEKIVLFTGSTKLEKYDANGRIVKTFNATAPTLLIDNTTHIPVRTLLEEFGYWVGWHDDGYIIVSDTDKTAEMNNLISAFNIA